jgi:hypothetical protein
MTIPAYLKTVPEILGYLQDGVSLADQAWISYANTISHAYATAYHNQQELLTTIKGSLEAKRQSEHESLALCLSVLCVGVVGPLAGVIVKKVL